MNSDEDTEDLAGQSESWAGDEETATPLPDDLFKALVSRQRRRVLSILLDTRELSLDELTDILAGSDVSIGGPTGPDEWAQVKIELVHAHLPLLVDAELISYDRGEDVVHLEPLPDPVYQTIQFATEYEQTLQKHGIGPY